MAIYQMLRTASFSPEDVERLATAYEDALQVLRIVNRADPITVVIAKRIIDAAKTGVRDFERALRRGSQRPSDTKDSIVRTV